MKFEMSPEPDAAERAAILAALEAEQSGRQTASPWTNALLPQREDAEDPDP